MNGRVARSQHSLSRPSQPIIRNQPAAQPSNQTTGRYLSVPPQWLTCLWNVIFSDFPFIDCNKIVLNYYVCKIWWNSKKCVGSAVWFPWDHSCHFSTSEIVIIRPEYQATHSHSLNLSIVLLSQNQLYWKIRDWVVAFILRTFDVMELVVVEWVIKRRTTCDLCEEGVCAWLSINLYWLRLYLNSHLSNQCKCS